MSACLSVCLPADVRDSFSQSVYVDKSVCLSVSVHECVCPTYSTTCRLSDGPQAGIETEIDMETEIDIETEIDRTDGLLALSRSSSAV